MSKEKQCECCHEWWYDSDVKEDLCPNCYDYFKQLKQKLKENEEIETSFEDEIVCPYCGYRMADDDGYFARQGDGEEKCPRCGKTFIFTANIEVTYSTTRKEDKQ